MTAEPLDLDELERLLVTYHAALSAPVEEGGVRRHRASLAEAVGQLENAAVNALPQLISSAREVEGLRQALRDVANPMRVLERRAVADGCKLGAGALQIADDPNFIKGIARAALSPSDAGGRL